MDYYRIPWSAGVIDPDFRKLLSNKSYVRSKTVAALGYTDDGKALNLDLARAPHILTAGATGSGKSVCINTIIQTLLLKNDPSTLELYFADVKKVDYIEFEDLPHTIAYTSNINEIHNMLLEIQNKMLYRFSLMQKYRVKNISDLPKTFPRLLLVFDEYASICNAESRRLIYPIIENIARLGRAAGVHLLLGIQRADRTVISGQTKANIPTRITFRVQSNTDSRIILDRSGAENLRGPGDGLLLSSCGDLYRFRGFMIPENQNRYILDFWNSQK